MTVADAIAKARVFLADDNEEQMFSDARLLESLNFAQRELRRSRPDLMVSSTGVTETYADATAVGDTLVWEDYWILALAHYTAYDVLLDESHNRANREEAATRLNLFKAAIRT